MWTTIRQTTKICRSDKQNEYLSPLHKLRARGVFYVERVFELKVNVSKIFTYTFIMFKDEIKRKLNVKDEMFPFALNMLGRHKLVVSGVKRVNEATANELKIKVGSDVLTITGKELSIAEIGGGDVYVEGEVESIAFKQNA